MIIETLLHVNSNCLELNIKDLINFIELMREKINDQNLNPWEGTKYFLSNCSRVHIRFRLPFVQKKGGGKERMTGEGVGWS